MTADSPKPIDKTVFSLAAVTTLGVSVPLLVFGDMLETGITDLYNIVATELGLLFQWAAIGSMVILAWLAFGRYGRIKFGDADDKPEFSTVSWIAMLFSSGVGGGLLYWAGVEWAFYYENPPFGAEPKSTEAIKWATSYGLFHWGFTAWCIYALPTIALCYSFYLRKIPFLRLSAAVMGEKNCSSFAGRLVDLFFMLGLIGGAGTALALTTPMISASLAELLGTERTIWLDVLSVSICVLLFGVSVYMGLEKGIKKLADANFLLSLLLLAFVLIAGPTGFILAMGTESIGTMVNNVFTMITWTDPVEKTGFVGSWTVFYWAWWIAFAPFVGIFVTRISKGRTIREIIFAMCVFGSMGAWAFYIVLGNFGLELELSGALPVAKMIAEDSHAAVPAMIMQLPFGTFALVVFTIVTIIYVATTYDSASYTLASAATKELHASENPGRWHRLFWAVVLGILPIGLMFIGGTKVVMSATLLAALPLMFAGVFMCRTLMKWLKEDFGEL
ncbi:BCCT family transporter [Kordiimonas sp.]|uniref:BCCT family transporter n=1 Tax=Kordiimonas sp. TaxID=1970157 RepID=UPI003A9537F1